VVVVVVVVVVILLWWMTQYGIWGTVTLLNPTHPVSCNRNNVTGGEKRIHYLPECNIVRYLFEEVIALYLSTSIVTEQKIDMQLVTT
jgi:hypothetical protein